ncbi:MAG: threonine-phosphate decarboxylase [Xanthomonadaceae bacterium]|nr:threonine-phosphate decarboxylase [Xanthomonadaceae bacterium]
MHHIDDRHGVMAIMVMEKQLPIHGGTVFQTARELGVSVEEILDFSANINPLGMPVRAWEALGKALDQLQHYPEMYADSLVKRIALLGNQPESRILAGNGSTELIYLLVRVLKPKSALIVAPAFTEYQRAVKVYGGKLDFYHTLDENNFVPETDLLIKALEKRPDILFMGNPNNPTGSLLRPEELHPLLDAARQSGTICIIDEAFIDFVDKPVSVDFLVGEFKNLVVLRSLTKIFSLAGLRCGYLLASSVLVERLRYHQEPWNVNSLAIAAAKEALADQQFQEDTRCFIARERDFLLQHLERIPFLQTFPSRANYLLMKLDRQYSSRRLSDFLRYKYQILIRLCTDFTGLDDSFIRIAVKNRENNLKLVVAMEEFFVS